MSQATIDILNTHRKSQIEISPSSEEFQIVAGGTFRGIFDEAHAEENKDTGNMKQKKTMPLIMVAEVPAGLTPHTTKIEREDGTLFTFNRVGKDTEGIPVLWLF